MNNLCGKIVLYAALLTLPLITFAQEGTDGPKPLAEVGSHWNYWMAREHTYGFRKYEVTAHKEIAAAVDRNGNGQKDADETEETVLAAEITVTVYENYRGSTEPGYTVDEGKLYAFRQGNVSYVLRDFSIATGNVPKKFWFKWIDMDAEPGDEWVITQFGSEGNTIFDWIQVSYRKEVEVDGQMIPVIGFSPACHSRYSQPEDFTSRLSLNGLFNIDFWEVSGGGAPTPNANGVVFAPDLFEISGGLLCAEVDGQLLTTPNLEEYVEANTPSIYEEHKEGLCDLLAAPEPVVASARRSINMRKPVVMSDSAPFTTSDRGRTSSPEVPLPEDEVITIPVVVHVVHNPTMPNRSVSEAQIQDMLDALNDAYGTVHEEQVREPFKSVIGNPHIRFDLAATDEAGQATTGIVYHETDRQYYPLLGENIREHYAYKFEKNGTPRNWDIKRYANIYIVDLGGFDQLSNAGGFVTNPEPTSDEQYNDYINWLEMQDMKFWQDWLDSDEGAMLDGLTVDMYYTFGGLNASNPYASFKTAIHELGHYLGLKHPSVTLAQKNGKYQPFGDGFEDTPYTQFTQYAMVACDEPIFQCGTLVQTENYMDYALDCACMFTQEQSAFMRRFAVATRPELIGRDDESGLPVLSGVSVSPTVTGSEVHINGTFESATLYTLSGLEVSRAHANRSTLDVSHLAEGAYLLQVRGEGNATAVFKIMVLF